jgi:cell wall-associated NlpC family hydrolase
MSTGRASAHRKAARAVSSSPALPMSTAEVLAAFDLKIAQLERAVAAGVPGASEELAAVLRDKNGVQAALAEVEQQIAENENPATWANVPPQVARADQAQLRAELRKKLADLREFGARVAAMNPTERQNLQNFFRLAKEDPEGLKRFFAGLQQAGGTRASAPAGAPANIRAAIEFGLSQLGAPYVGGGSPFRFGKPGDGRTYQLPGQRAYVSPKGVIGYDCSGLVVTMLKKAGINISHLSSSRAMKAGLPQVSKHELQPGDLLVKNGHVAMYIGNGQMIEAVPSGVKVSDAKKYINDPEYTGHRPR